MKQSRSILEFRRQFGVPAQFKFAGFVICNMHKEDYLFKYSGESSNALFSQWTPSPEFSLKFSRYKLASDVIDSFEWHDKAAVLIAFENRKQIAVCEIPSDFLLE
ncbi:TPA: hypothetical protein G9F27_000609 [Salmonella enterica]|uniref:Uncharacterized protein n=1 Tax=Salmonella enterica TaxID=28901 RepID=A0A743SL66_SALER|nr:hypothetical protein [Salmonella enterica]